jgi:hypothetical protein
MPAARRGSGGKRPHGWSARDFKWSPRDAEVVQGKSCAQTIYHHNMMNCSRQAPRSLQDATDVGGFRKSGVTPEACLRHDPRSVPPARPPKRASDTTRRGDKAPAQPVHQCFQTLSQGIPSRRHRRRRDAMRSTMAWPGCRKTGERGMAPACAGRAHKPCRASLKDRACAGNAAPLGAQCVGPVSAARAGAVPSSGFGLGPVRLSPRQPVGSVCDR